MTFPKESRRVQKNKTEKSYKNKINVSNLYKIQCHLVIHLENLVD